jgi:hypothetical protein
MTDLERRMINLLKDIRFMIQNDGDINYGEIVDQITLLLREVRGE